MHLLGEELKQVQGHIPPASRTAGATNGTGVDTTGAVEAIATVIGGDIAASTTLDVKLQESDDNSAWSDISGAAITQLVAADDNKSPAINLPLDGRKTRKKYIRAVSTVAGAGAVVSGVDLKLRMKAAPVTNTPATVFP